MQINLGPIAPVPSSSAGSATVGADAAGGDSPFARLLAAQQGTASAEASKTASDAVAEPSADGIADDAKPEEVATDDSDCATLDPALSDWLAAMQRPVAAAPEPAQAEAAAANSVGVELDTQAQMSAAASGNAMPASPVSEAHATALSSPVGAKLAPQAATAWAEANTTPNTKPDTSTGTLLDAAPLPQHGAVQGGERPVDPSAQRAVERTTLPTEFSQASEPSARAALEQLLVASAREHEVAGPRIERSLAVESASAVAVMAATPRADGIASPMTVSLTTPAMAPEFRAELGVQVSLLARNGVQHAELRLNPAEMGPISVQIALSGTQAQIDFGADSATTRQIIESGLPELAAALRDAGLTLAGGGVSQHSRGRSQGDGAEPGGRGDAQGLAGGAGEDTSQPAMGRVNWRAPQGAVDLYA